MKLYKNIFILAILAGSLCACSDLINPSIQNIQSEEQMFDSPATAQSILGFGYANLPFETKSTTDIATDDAVSNDVSTNNAIRSMSQGTWSAVNDPISRWASCRLTIQYMNIFLKHVAEVEWSSNAGKQVMFIDKLTGEALALRALNMYYLLRNHGGWTAGGQLLGVPILLEPEGWDSDFNQQRATFQACVEQIYKDVDAAMELLPYDYVTLTNDADVPQKYQKIGVTNAGEYSAVFGATFRGRMSGRIAQTVKALTALLAASPAYAAGTEVTYADAANEASAILKTIGGVSGIDPVGYKWFMDKTTLNSLGSGECPPEILWRGSMNNGTESYAFGISQEADNYPPTLYGKGRINPTQNLVDAFPMANGYPITDEVNSGYSASDPYAGRDPRLAEYVIYNGATYAGAQIITGAYSSDNNGLNKISTSTRTGYYLRKLLRDDCNPNPSVNNAQKHYPVYIRYTELFLAYAEAANEAWGPTAAGPDGFSAYDVIKAIRNRAGVGMNGDDPYLNSCDTKEKMRELIRNERRIELCFENKRFWDMRRWGLDLTEPAMGVKIEQSGTALQFTEFEVEPRNYADHMNYGPIPDSEVRKWTNLDQNAGW